MDRLRQLAGTWTAGLPRGQAQIQAIIKHLRTEYVLDPDARPPQGASCPVTHFLFEAKRGPDYQFATAAAILLRTLGYSTRLVGGFYVSPERYDYRLQHTPVVAADAHIWAEVHVTGQQWLTVEATPGYEELQPPPGWLEIIIRSLDVCRLWVLDNILVWTMLGVLGAMGWWWKVPLQIWLAWCRWRWLPSREPRRHILQTLSFMETCWRLRNRPRPPGIPPINWATRQFSSTTVSLADLRLLGLLADWACFAPDHAPLPIGLGGGWKSLCERVARAVQQWKPPVRNSRTTEPQSLSPSIHQLSLKYGDYPSS